MITLNITEDEFWDIYLPLLERGDELRVKGRKEPAKRFFDLAENLYQQRKKEMKNDSRNI